MHSHDHGHGHHHHHHDLKLADVNRALVIGIVLNIIFVVLEIAAGLWYNSLALLSDAGHNFSDVIALVIALGAFKLLSIQPNNNYTYGYRKTTIWAALLNAILLLVAVGAILWESFARWFNPVEVDGVTTAMVAGVGIIINGITAWLFVKDKDKDLNIKGAYLHMLADTLVSVGVVLSGLLILATGWDAIDTIMSWVIVGIILISTWSLLKDSLKLSLDGVPTGIDIASIKQKIVAIEGIQSIHHIHIWALSTTENAMTAHLVIPNNGTFESATKAKKEIRHLLEHENIQHVTLELEKEMEDCHAENCTILLESDNHDGHHHH
jgi:cobalt-zinc-cadmium efflux system protein